MNGPPPDDRQDQAGKSGAAANVGDRLRPSGDQLEQLGRIKKMAAPDVIETVRSHQVDGAVPLDQQRDIGFQPCLCFT